MKSQEQLRLQPELPPLLDGFYDETAQSVFEHWRQIDKESIIRRTPSSVMASLPGEKNIRYAELLPEAGDYDEDETSVLVLSAGNTWHPENYMKAEIIRQLVAPNGRMIVFTHNNYEQRAYNLTSEELKEVSSGEMRPISERQMRVCESLGITSLKMIMGHSCGAATAASFTGVASPYIDVKSGLFSEAPNTFHPGERSLWALRMSMLRESKRIRDAKAGMSLPAVSEFSFVGNPLKALFKSTKWALGANSIPENRALNEGFLRDGFFTDIAHTLLASPNTTVSVINGQDSYVCNNQGIQNFMHETARNFKSVVPYVCHEGNHSTAVSPFVLGLFGRRAFEWYVNLHPDVSKAQVPQYQSYPDSDNHSPILNQLLREEQLIA